MADETIKLRVDTGDPELDKRLVRRLTEEYEGIAAFMRREASGERDRYDMVIDEEYEGNILPVSRLVSDLSQIYLKRTGKTLIRPKKGQKALYWFSSLYGGSGLSSVAFVFSRLLAMKKGEKVLYIDMGSGGTFDYFEGEDPEKPVGELVFLIKTGREFALDEYISRDHFGIDVLSLKDADHEIVRAIEASSGHDAIVFSSHERRFFADSKEVLVLNAKDARITEEMRLVEGKGIRIINREYINKVDKDRILVSDDLLSFKNPSGRVRIAMDGDFSLGVEKLLRIISNDNGLSEL